MTPELRNLAADLLVLYGDRPSLGDGLSLDALVLCVAAREAIDALRPGLELWPTAKVCRALAEMLRADDLAPKSREA